VTEAYGPLTPAVRHPSGGGPLRAILSRIAQRLAKESGKAVDDTNVLLLWTRATGAVAVSASGSPENIKQIALTQGLPPLAPEEVQEISDAGRKIHFRHYVRVESAGARARADVYRPCRRSTWRTSSRLRACPHSETCSVQKMYDLHDVSVWAVKVLDRMKGMVRSYRPCQSL
jgi:hypothetical protein